MNIAQRGSIFYLVKRVPVAFAHVDGRSHVWVSLRTDSRREAERRAVDAIRDLENQWISKSRGQVADVQRFEALSSLSANRGFPYLPANEVAGLELLDLLRRITTAQEGKVVANAVLGGEPIPRYRLSEVIGIYIELVAVEVKDKSPDQRRVWENTLKRSIGRLMCVVGDKFIDDLSRQDVLMYRSHWSDRIREEGLSATSANRELTAVAGVFSKLYKLKGLGDPALFRNLAFSSKKKRRPPYDQGFIRDRILPELVKSSLNEDAADILKILINTGMRPSEVTGLAAGDIYLDAPIPYLAIRPREGRELKTQTSIRDIPLVGIALDAASRHPDGFERYLNKTATLSQTIKKFLKAKNLRPTRDHCLYSFRHSFQDRLTAVEAPDRMQADLMGHRYIRERYGVGPSLEQKAKWLAKISYF